MARRGKTEAVSTDAALDSAAPSTLQLIREKELEIDARLLSVREDAEGVVAEARQRAAETIARSETDAEASIREREQAVRSESEAAVSRVQVQAEEEIAAINERAAWRRERAVDSVVSAVLTIREGS